MNKIIFSLMLLVLAKPLAFSQSVGIGTTTPDASSVLELKANNKGFLPPRMTASDKGLILSPKAGLMIYQTDATPGLYIYNGTAWVPVAAGGTVLGGWSLTGNSGTNPASNFIGTTDNQPLKFKVNNIGSGEVNPVNGNTALGQYALSANGTGGQNTALGYNSLAYNTDGIDNTGLGLATLFSNTSGRSNAAFGKSAMVSNKTGTRNTAAGTNSLYQNVSGNLNIAVGMDAAYSNTTGSNSIAIGDSALFNNNSSYNVAIGSKALFTNSTGVSNTAVGAQTLTNNQTGSQNTAVGRIALFSNKTGIQNTALGNQAGRYNESGNANTAVGFQSLLFNVLNSNNTAVGQSALSSTISDNNTAVGQASLSANTFGYGNTAVGKDAMLNNVDGNYNTAIGYKAAIYGSNYVNATAIGANAQSACSNCVVLGSTNGYNGANANARVGIGTTNPQKTLHVNPNGAGGIAIGNDLNTGGYTNLNMGISQAAGGYSFIQSVQAAGSTPTYGDLVLNPSGGNVAIGKSTASTPLHIKQTTDNLPYNGSLRLERHDNGNFWDISVSYADVLHLVYKGVEKVRFSNIDGDIWQSSDQRLKKDIQNFETALPRLMKLEAKSYHYKDNEDGAPLSYGFIAQEVEKIFPGAVATMGKDGMKAIAYQKLNILAIKSIQEQQVIIEAQQKQIDEVKQQNALMMESIKKLEKAIEEIRDTKK
ncbi:MAG: tail fiber domain-containing protein [Ferruginibacter sp.]